MAQTMETRYTHSPEDIRHYSTEQLRKEFLVEKVFVPGDIVLTYTHSDRQIFGGVTPINEPLSIQLSKELGVDYFLERRELGVINIGGPGSIAIEGKEEPMKKQDGYYIGKGTKDVVFKSDDPENPAKFYCVSVPAHHKYPNVKISIDQISPRETGEDVSMNKRKIYQYIIRIFVKAVSCKWDIRCWSRETPGTRCRATRMNGEWKHIYTLIWNRIQGYSTLWENRMKQSILFYLRSRQSSPQAGQSTVGLRQAIIPLSGRCAGKTSHMTIWILCRWKI